LSTQSQNLGAIPAVSVVAARSGVGKTTLIEKLIIEFTRRGYRVGTLKDDAHRFEMDHEGKDTWRFMQAGARATAIIGAQQYALIQKTETKQDLLTLLALIEDVDIILVEGFKKSPLPRLEVVRAALGTNIVSEGDRLLAVVTDSETLETDKPLLPLNDAAKVADFLVGALRATPVSGQ
jgi:molybdopterin-guanine dinucleotide biosynthesis protein B